MVEISSFDNLSIEDIILDIIITNKNVPWLFKKDHMLVTDNS